MVTDCAARHFLSSSSSSVGNPRAQDARESRLERVRTDGGGQHGGLAKAHQDRPTGPDDLARTLQHADNLATRRALKSGRLALDARLLFDEVAAADEDATLLRLAVIHRDWLDEIELRRPIVHHREALLDVQLARLAVGLEAPVVVEAVGDVGILLQLVEDDAVADRMDRSGGDQDDIARVDLDTPQVVLQPGLGDGAADFVLGGLLLQPVDDLGAVVGLQDIPRLGFAETAVLMLSGVLVVGVDLHRELILRVDELGEERKRMPKTATARAPISASPYWSTSAPSVWPV